MIRWDVMCYLAIETALAAVNSQEHNERACRAGREEERREESLCAAAGGISMSSNRRWARDGVVRRYEIKEPKV